MSKTVKGADPPNRWGLVVVIIERMLASPHSNGIIIRDKIVQKKRRVSTRVSIFFLNSRVCS
jgi:hypothetical protein